MTKRGGQQQGQEVPLIHRTMSVEVARSIVYELDMLQIDRARVGPELLALKADIIQVLQQLESGDVKRPC